MGTVASVGLQDLRKDPQDYVRNSLLWKLEPSQVFRANIFTRKIILFLVVIHHIIVDLDSSRREGTKEFGIIWITF